MDKLESSSSPSATAHVPLTTMDDSQSTIAQISQETKIQSELISSSQKSSMMEHQSLATSSELSSLSSAGEEDDHESTTTVATSAPATGYKLNTKIRIKAPAAENSRRQPRRTQARKQLPTSVSVSPASSMMTLNSTEMAEDGDDENVGFEDEDEDDDFYGGDDAASVASRQSASQQGSTKRGKTGAARKPGRKRKDSNAAAGGSKTASASDIPLPDTAVELEKILFRRVRVATEAENTEKEEFLVKFRNRSYLHCEWVDREWIEMSDKRGKQRLKHFMEKTMHEIAYASLTDERPFNESYTVIDRLIATIQYPDPFSGDVTQWYLVKWAALPYNECTWETEALLLHECDDTEQLIKDFQQRQLTPIERDPAFFNTYLPVGVRLNAKNWQALTESPVFKDDNQLRSYQLEGLNWLLYCWYHHQSCIIADEMGLGKTIQSVTFLNQLYHLGVRGPFLIVAPLSTIPHWERTVHSWTDLNAVVFHGNQQTRNIIQNYEFYYRDPVTNKPMKQISVPIAGRQVPVPQLKFDIMITTYEMAMSAAATLRNLTTWRVVVVDEAHRLKNKSSKVGEAMKAYSFEHRLLLTGTPLQNNLEELWSILNFMDPRRFPDGTEKQFLQEYDIRSAADVERLQALLKPLMLRRLKEDVEKTIPVKEETIIEVEMTNTQRVYYRAILERNFWFLKQGSKRSNVPNLINTMLELRKCCIHPYLIKGAEEKVLQEEKATTPEDFFRCLIHSSGKLVLLDKLLPKLKEGGHRVLIFSQMTRCLDILQDYMRGRGYKYERIDGGIRGEARQAAIDRFSAPDSDIFVFLLCTRAGGVGINLTAADTCIIFDSDWNPQNDLQAQARCHRIGQKKNVQIYRLLMRDTYEKTMFDKAGMKLGLDRAVLSRMDFDPNDAGTGGPPSSMSKAEIEELLKRGAYAALETQRDEGTSMMDEDIDSILERRARVIRHDEDKKIEAEGSLFSKASFALTGDANTEGLDMEDPEFWDKWATQANISTAAAEAPSEPSAILGPRKRKFRQLGENGEEAEFSDEDDVGGRDTARRAAAVRARVISSKINAWTLADRMRVERGIMLYGFGAWEKKIEQFPKRSINEIKAAEVRLLRYCCEQMRLTLEKPRSSDAASNPGSDDEGGSASSTPQKPKLAAPSSLVNEQRQAREDMRMVEDVEYVITTVRWEVPNLNEVQNMIVNGCADSFKPKTYTVEIDDELGPYPFPGATQEDLLIYRTMIDDAPKNYFDHLSKKVRNLLTRAQNCHFMRQHITDTDPHVCGDIWVPMPGNGQLPSAFNPANAINNFVNKYDPVFEVRLKKFYYPPLYFQYFTDNGGMPGWGQDEDRDLLVGIVKYGYQMYDRMQVDPQLIFSDESRWAANPQHLADIKAQSPDRPVETNVFPGASDVGNRLRRLMNTYQRDVRENRSGAIPPPPRVVQRLHGEDMAQHRWNRRDRCAFVQAVSMYGLPLEIHEEVPAGETQGKRVISDEMDGKVMTVRRDWAMLQDMAGLQHKTDLAMEVFSEAVIRRLDEIVYGTPPDYSGVDVIVPMDFTGQPCDACETVNLERGRRIVRRLIMFKTLRAQVLTDPYLDIKLRAAKRSPGLPDWWVTIVDDKNYLKGTAKYGCAGNRQHLIAFDPELGFRDRMLAAIKEKGMMDQFTDPYGEEGLKAAKAASDKRQTEESVDEDMTDVSRTNEGEEPVEQRSVSGLETAPQTPSSSATAATSSAITTKSGSLPASGSINLAQHPTGINIEEVCGWPRDVIRLRRVDILIELVQNPTDRRVHALLPSGSQSQVDASQQQQSSLSFSQSSRADSFSAPSGPPPLNILRQLINMDAQQLFAIPEDRASTPTGSTSTRNNYAGLLPLAKSMKHLQAKMEQLIAHGQNSVAVQELLGASEALLIAAGLDRQPILTDNEPNGRSPDQPSLDPSTTTAAMTAASASKRQKVRDKLCQQMARDLALTPPVSTDPLTTTVSNNTIHIHQQQQQPQQPQSAMSVAALVHHTGASMDVDMTQQ